MVSFGSLTVLVVDDVVNMRRLLKNMLRQMGVTNILEASDGILALDVLVRNTVDLVLCDWNMPQMKGIEVLKFVRAKQEIKNMPFIMVTAEVKEDVIAEAAETEVDAYLLKPFTLQQLQDRVTHVLKLQEEVSEIDQRLARGMSYITTRQMDKAAEELKAALAINPKSPRTLYTMGKLFEEQGADSRAKEMFEKAVTISPKFLKGHEALANLFQALGDMDGYIKHMEKAVKISPRNMERRFMLGQSLVSAGRKDEAKKLFNEILQTATAQFAEIAEKVGEALLAIGEAEEAEKAFNKALETSPESLHLFNRLGIAFRQQKKYAEAIANYKKALQVAPGNSALMYNLGRAFFEAGDKKSALSTLGALVKAHPDFTEAQDLLAKVEAAS
ncbi:MAG: tetratricopeptide repeat protein [Desulfarculus sp.]|nr:tetratricopeptide repeat protein [Desulfarculus sp.]